MENKQNNENIKIKKEIDELENLKAMTEIKQREVDLYFYNDYINQQKEHFIKLLNFINEHIVNELNAEGGIITEPIRLEARIKSPDSTITNDHKSRDPYDLPLKEGEEEENSDLSDIFGITLVYSGDEIEDNILNKSRNSKKPFVKPERNKEIENLILSRIDELFIIHQKYDPEHKIVYSGLPGFQRHFKPNTGYDSLHGTAHLKPNYEEAILKDLAKEDFKLVRENIPLVEFHVTESKIYRIASRDFYHILKFADHEDKYDFEMAQKSKDTQKMDEIIENVKQKLQYTFNKKGYNFIPETSIPEMYISTDTGTIRQLPKEGLNGTIKKLFYFLDISKVDFKHRLKATSSPASTFKTDNDNQTHINHSPKEL